MRRINTPDGLYHNADPIAGDAGTIVTAEALNAVQEEICAVIIAAGIALDAADNKQLLAAIQAISGTGIAWGAITGKPATATRWPAWDEVTAKPALSLQGHGHIINDVSGLPAALDGLSASIAARAPKDTPVFTNRVTLDQELVAASGALVLGAGTGIGKNGAVYLRPDGTGSGLGALFVARDGISWDNKTVWHDGNFDPATKAPINAPTFTGIVRIESGVSTQLETWSSGAYNVVNLKTYTGGRSWQFGTAQVATPGVTPGSFFIQDLATSTAQFSVDNSGAQFSVPVSLAALAASGAITGASIRSTGTIMAAGGFQVG